MIKRFEGFELLNKRIGLKLTFCCSLWHGHSTRAIDSLHAPLILCNSLLVFLRVGAVYFITPYPQIYITLVQWRGFLLARAVYMSQMVANRKAKYNLSLQETNISEKQ